MGARKKKPIAILTDDLAYAIQWALTNYSGNVESYHSRRRTIDLIDGTWFIICTQPEHLLGMEISDYKSVGGNKKPASWHLKMVEMAGTRIR